MTKEIVLIHGAFAGPWCMADYAGFFRQYTPRRRGSMAAIPPPSPMRV